MSAQKTFQTQFHGAVMADVLTASPRVRAASPACVGVAGAAYSRRPPSLPASPFSPGMVGLVIPSWLDRRSPAFAPSPLKALHSGEFRAVLGGVRGLLSPLMSASNTTLHLLMPLYRRENGAACGRAAFCSLARAQDGGSRSLGRLQGQTVGCSRLGSFWPALSLTSSASPGFFPSLECV